MWDELMVVEAEMSDQIDQGTLETPKLSKGCAGQGVIHEAIFHLSEDIPVIELVVESVYPPV